MLGSTLTLPPQTMTGSYNNNAYAVTAEVGHKFNLSELAFIEPQAEVIYGRVVGDDFTASNGTRFSQKDYDSLIGRLGARAGFSFPENKGQYLRSLLGCSRLPR